MSMRPIVFLCVWCLAAVTATSAQSGKKVFISVDLEGISGVSGDDQLNASGAEYAKAGTPTGLFAHTGSGIVADVRINGRSVGEGGLNTLVAEWYGVPVVVVTGDDVAVAQVAAVATGATTVVTKRAINQRSVELRPLADVHRDISAAARDGVMRARRTAPARTPPYRVEVQLRTTLIPQVAEILPGIQRPAPDTLAFSAETMPQAYAIVRFFYRYVNPD